MDGKHDQYYFSTLISDYRIGKQKPASMFYIIYTL